MTAKVQSALLVASLAAAFASCGKPSDREATSTSPASAEPSPAVVLGDNDLGRVCRAAVAALNGRDPAIIKVERVADGVAHVGYARPDDGKVWKNQCRVEGNRVIWASVDLNGPGSGPGRWRTDAEDEVVTYVLDGGTVKVKITYSDGSAEPEKAYE